MGLPTLKLQTSFRVVASNVRGLKEQTVSVAKATYRFRGSSPRSLWRHPWLAFAALIEAAEIEASGGQSRGPRHKRVHAGLSTRSAGASRNERHDKRPTCDNSHRVPEARHL